MWPADLGVHILSVCVVDLALLQRSEVEEVRWSVDLVVELLGVGQLQVILHVWIVPHACGGGEREDRDDEENKRLDQELHFSQFFTVFSWENKFT